MRLDTVSITAGQILSALLYQHHMDHMQEPRHCRFKQTIQHYNQCCIAQPLVPAAVSQQCPINSPRIATMTLMLGGDHTRQHIRTMVTVTVTWHCKAQSMMLSCAWHSTHCTLTATHLDNYTPCSFSKLHFKSKIQVVCPQHIASLESVIWIQG